MNRDDLNVLSYLRKNPGKGDSILVVLNMSGEPRTVKVNLSSLGIKSSSAKTLIAAPETGQESVPLAQLNIPAFGVFIGSVQ